MSKEIGGFNGGASNCEFRGGEQLQEALITRPRPFYFAPS